MCFWLRPVAPATLPARSCRSSAVISARGKTRHMDDSTRTLLLYFIMPVWFLAGFADYLCHRATDIAHTTGPKESLFHLFMFGEIAIPLLMCLFLEINALVFAVMIVAFLAHEATALWD